MKRDRIVKYCLLLAALGISLLVGCTSNRTARRPVVVTPTGQVFVPEAPPPPREDVKGSPPSTASVWTPGYYTYSNGHWVWLPGRWETPPPTGKTWVAGHWDKTERGWYWTPGHWE